MSINREDGFRRNYQYFINYRSRKTRIIQHLHIHIYIVNINYRSVIILCVYMYNIIVAYLYINQRKRGREVRTI